MQTDHLDRILQTLNLLYDRCRAHLALNEKICEDSRTLLKPWPKKKKKKEDVPAGGDQNTQPKNLKDEIPVQELEELSMVEKVLAKAERARNRFSKQSDPQSAKETKSDKKPVLVSNPSATQQTVTSSTRNQAISTTMIIKPGSSQTKPTLSGKPTNRTKPSGSRVTNPSTSKTNPVSQAHINKLIGRPASGNKNKTGHIPAHIHAPFKTAPEPARTVQRSKPRGVSSGPVRPTLPHKTTHSNRERYLAKAKEQTRNLPVSMHADFTSKSQPSDANENDDRVDEERITHDDIVANNQIVSDDTVANNHQDLRTDRDSAQDSHMVSAPSSLPDCSQSVEAAPTEPLPVDKESVELPEDRFTLLSQGRQLSMPPKFNKLMAQNRRLREKLNSLCRSDPGNLSVAEEEFMNRVQEEMDQEGSGDWKKMLSLCHLYEALTCVLDGLPLSAGEKLLKKGDWREMYRWRHKLHLVLIAYTTVEQQYQQLVTGLPVPQLKSGKSALRLSSWNSVSRRFEEIHRSPDVYWLPSHIGSAPVPPAGLRYNSRKQLVEYATAVHEAQLLSLQLHICTAMEPILQDLAKMDNMTSELQITQDVEDRINFHWTEGRERKIAENSMDLQQPRSDYSRLYRALYSLACHLGQASPTIVTDIIDELDDNLQSQQSEHDF